MNSWTSGRKVLAGITACTWILGSAQAADQVLIMTISEYDRSPLPGVKHDAKNALQLAQKLGFNTAQATVLKDQQLTSQGMRQALREFSARVQTNDRVFFYYSGHGASYLNRGQCSAALVSHDAQLVDTQEIKQYLDQMKEKVQDALVIFDACHSGGHQDLALMTAGGKSRGAIGDARPTGLSGKTWTPKEGESCNQPINFTKSWPVPQIGARSITNPDNNFTFISAASEQQVALDDKERGGLATTSLLQCASEGVVTNGLATPATLAACAQSKVDVAVPVLNAKYGSKWTAHTLEVKGNKQRSLAQVKTVPQAEPAQNAPVASSASAQVIQRLEQYLAGANGNWVLSVQPTALNINLSQSDAQRGVAFPFTSSQPGYGYVLYVGSDGKDMYQLFPEPGENNAMPASGKFPETRIDGPGGKNTFLFLLTQTPRDFSQVFKANGVAISGDVLTNVQCEMENRNAVRINGQAQCGGKRNAVRTDKEKSLGPVEGYAAQLVVVEGR